ncbi:MAG: IgGFc-binding protein [Myxococcota bacterium]
MSTRPTDVIQRFIACALLCVIGLASACDRNSTHDETCPDGQRPDGACFLPTDAESDASDAEDSADSEDTTDGDISANCTPGDSRCATATAIEACGPNGSAWNRQDCGEGLICDDARCVEGEPCDPGEVSGCRSQTSQQVCADDGVTFRERRCPSEAPNCFDGECIEGTCRADAIFCDGDALSRCDTTGDSATVIETCEYACQDAACTEPPDERCTEKSYIGCDFWAVDLDNYTKRCSTSLDCSIGTCQSEICVDEDANRQQFAITVTNVSDDQVEVQVIGPNNVVEATEVLDPHGLRRIQLRQRDSLDTARHSQSFRVRADGPITVHQFNPENDAGVFSSDASLLLPINALGREYRVMGWPTLEQPSLASFPSTNKAYVTIVATDIGQTYVTVETPVEIQAGPDIASIPADTSQNFTLTQGMVLQLATVADSSREYDLTGLKVLSSKPVAVFSGHECAFVPTDTPACDHLEQQLMPQKTWGTEYIAPKFAPRGREDDIFRVLAAEDGTELTTTPPIAEVDGATLNAGDVVEFASKSSFSLTATRPVSVAQYMVGALYPGPLQGCDPASGVEYGCLVDTRADCEVEGNSFDFPIGDPAFTMTVPTHQFRSEYVVVTPEGYRDDYVSVVAPSDATVSVDGAPISGMRNPIDGTNWVVTWVPVEPGAHRVSSDVPFGLYSYGYACFISYAYPGGLNLGTGQ